MKINRKQTIQQAVDSLKYESVYINPDVKIPNIGPKDIELEFFTLGKDATNDEIRAEYEKRGMVPDFFATIAYLKEHPEVLEEKKYIGIQLEGNCCAIFRRWDGRRSVRVRQRGSGWGGHWWFPCRRKSLELELPNTSGTQSLDLTRAIEICKENGLTVSKIY